MTKEGYSPYPKTIIGRMLDALFNFTGSLTGSGSWKVRPLQQNLIDALLLALEPEVRALVTQQLNQPYYISFWHDGRVSPFFFRNFNLPQELRISNTDFADRLYNIEMIVDGRKQYAHVTFYKGRIHCLEFKKPLKFYKGKDVRFGKVAVGNPKHSVTRIIDRREHGKDSSIATGEE
jgi:hypothetical protein